MNSLERMQHEHAAKAAGITLLFSNMNPPRNVETGNTWNPRGDDGDALRLAATVGIHLEWNRKPHTLYRSSVQASVMGHGHHALVVDYEGPQDAAAAAREAIFLVAASYGATLP
jgi:hypothetical protein